MKTVVFDKTGTITEGKPRVVRVIPTVPSSTFSVNDIILLAGSAESNSEHPIGTAIATFSKEVCLLLLHPFMPLFLLFQFLGCQQWAPVHNFQSSVGRGISCEVKNIETLRNLIVKNSDEQCTVQLVQKTHRINDHEVEIQPPILDIVNTTENMKNLNSYQVVIGSESWAAENQVNVSDVVKATLSEERATGNISVLVSANGTLFVKRLSTPCLFF